MASVLVGDPPAPSVHDQSYAVAALGGCTIGRTTWNNGEIFAWVEGHLWSFSSQRWEEEAAEVIGKRFLGLKGDLASSNLGDLDGQFLAVVYDSRSRVAHLISDPLGTYSAYWTRWSGGVAWATAYRTFLSLPGFSPEIDGDALGDFVGVGFLGENRTWLRGVEMIPPGSVVSISAKNTSVRIRTWSDRARSMPEVSRSSTEEAVEELAYEFREAVSAHVTLMGVRPALTLSGGWDSRAILGAFAEVVPAPFCLTRGVLESHDVRWATQVGRAVGARHVIFPLGPRNWLRNRVRAVWQTEAMSPIQHLNAAPTVDVFQAFANVNLHGAAGELLKGKAGAGTIGWLSPVRLSRVERFLGSEAADRSIERWRSWIASIPSPELGYLLGRFRRFTSSAARIERAWGIRTRFPYVDPRFLTTVLSRPRAELADGDLAGRVFGRAFPHLFGPLPSARSVGVGRQRLVSGAVAFSRKALGRTRGVLGAWGLPFRDPRIYQDMVHWFRRAPASDLLERLLLVPKPHLAEFIPRERIWGEVRHHLNGGNRTEELGALLTVEIWLRQLESSSSSEVLEDIASGTRDTLAILPPHHVAARTDPTLHSPQC